MSMIKNKIKSIFQNSKKKIKLQQNENLKINEQLPQVEQPINFCNNCKIEMKVNKKVKISGLPGKIPIYLICGKCGFEKRL